jgi:hypothetical protein
MTFNFLGVWTSCVIQPCQVLLRWQISWSVLHGLQPHLHVSPTVWTIQHAVELVACPTFVRNSALATSLSSTSATSSMHIWLVNLSWYYLQTARCIKCDVNVHNVGLHFLDKIYASVNLTSWVLTDRLCGLVVRVPGYRSRGRGSIPGATRLSEKWWVWNRVHSASWVQLRSYLKEEVAAPV